MEQRGQHLLQITMCFTSGAAENKRLQSGKPTSGSQLQP